MSQVHLVPADRSDPDDVLAAKVEAVWDSAGLATCFAPRDLTALKLHVGEPGNRTFVSPVVAAALVRRIEAAGARPFLTDSVVLYKSPRDTGPGLARVAIEHGFGPDRVGAPFVPADGVTGADGAEVSVGGRHFDRVSIASAILHARSLLVLSHATGHLGTGYGGALKNIGMGCCTKKAKLRQHHGHHPRIDPDECRGCGTCAEWCPSGAISVDGTATIDEAVCIGCGECVAACQEHAVEFGWSISGRELQERIVEHAAAIIRGKPERIGYVTVATRVTKDCDCIGVAQEPLLPDIGILASRDPVALDQAVLDLVRERAGRTLESMTYPSRDGSWQLAHAEALGLGERAVELVTVRAP